MQYDSAAVSQFASSLAKWAKLEGSAQYLEKDIWLSYVLRHIHSTEGAHDELAFKGGTCLVKCHYGHYRFSEDLDFTWIGRKSSKLSNRRQFREKYIDPLAAAFGLEPEIAPGITDGEAHSHSGKILNYFFLLPQAEGALRQKVKISVSFDETLCFPKMQAEVKGLAVSKAGEKELAGLFGKIAEDYFRPFSVTAYSKEEIACEKVRALLTRKEKINRSRDIVDLFHLSKDVPLEKAVLCNGCRGKIIRSLKIQSYGSVFRERARNIESHLLTMVEYARNEPIYVQEIDYAALREFARGSLKSVVEKLCREV